MRILLTGGTGLIGRALCRHWLAQGHRLVVFSRTPERVAALCGPGVQACGETVRGIGRVEELSEEAFDAVVNLAGAPIADRPWTAKRRAVLRDSRIKLTEDLIGGLQKLGHRVPVFLSGSAVGWYGDGGDRILTEASAPAGEDFAMRLCQDWERVADGAKTLGARVVTVRTGLVLAREGGILQRMLPAFRLGLGGPIGNGRQWMPWIHLADQVALIDFLLHRPEAQGAWNACAPNPVRNADFSRALAQHLHRPEVFRVPIWALRLLGDVAGLLLGGQNLRPARLLETGFTFRFSNLDEALADLLER